MLQTFEIFPQFPFQVFVPQLHGIKLDQDRAIGRMQISYPGNGLQFHEPEEFPHTLMCFERDLLTEVDQERLVARSFEPYIVLFSWAHAAKVYRAQAVPFAPWSGGSSPIHDSGLGLTKHPLS